MKHDRDAISKLQKAVHQGTFTLLHKQLRSASGLHPRKEPKHAHLPALEMVNTLNLDLLHKAVMEGVIMTTVELQQAPICTICHSHI